MMTKYSNKKNQAIKNPSANCRKEININDLIVSTKVTMKIISFCLRLFCRSLSGKLCVQNKRKKALYIVGGKYLLKGTK